jgi:hypothetical protein
MLPCIAGSLSTEGSLAMLNPQSAPDSYRDRNLFLPLLPPGRSTKAPTGKIIGLKKQNFKPLAHYGAIGKKSGAPRVG